MKTVVVEFALDKETKNRVKYTNPDYDFSPVAGMLYLFKGAVTVPYPKRIRITVEEVQ